MIFHLNSKGKSPNKIINFHLNWLIKNYYRYKWLNYLIILMCEKLSLIVKN